MRDPQERHATLEMTVPDEPFEDGTVCCKINKTKDWALVHTAALLIEVKVLMLGLVR